MLHTGAHHARQADPGGPTLTVSADDLRALSKPALHAGISLADILRSVDLPSDLLDDSRAASVSLADYFRILERLSIAAHDESWGLSARPLLPGATGLVLGNLAGCRNLFEAMKAVANAYNLLHGGTYNRVELRDDRVVYIIDDSDFPYTLPTDSEQVCFTMECVLMFLHGMLSMISQSDLHSLLMRVQTKRAQPANGNGYMAFWPATIGWRSRHFALHYDLAAFSLPIRHEGLSLSSQAIYRHVIELIERKQCSAPRPRGLLERLTEIFAENIYSQSAVARQLGLSVATLRRRLKEEGHPAFRTLCERARSEAAKSMLARGRHPRDVAEELG
ncbi:MAG TPA: AraC family transcriptional regulator ligand-binding domain-containing protein, partial [Steroidobacter sp.]